MIIRKLGTKYPCGNLNEIHLFEEESKILDTGQFLLPTNRLIPAKNVSR